MQSHSSLIGCAPHVPFSRALICAGALLLAVLSIPVHADGGITLNFKDADIREVAATIGQITHRNFIIDPRVQGRVTVIRSEERRGG